jgi:hypothetical protein
MRPLPISTLLLAALAGALSAAPHAAAQGTLTPGSAAEGALTATDPVLDDDSHYDLWTFRGVAGRRYAVTLRSTDFDAYLAVGVDAGSGCDLCLTDDDGGGGTDSRVVFRAPADGVYQIRANSLGGGETGRYTLSLAELPPLRATGEVRAGETVQGTLQEGDEEADDGSWMDLWTLRGRAGERLVLTLRSEDFDAYLAFGRIVDGGFVEIASDDDGGGGLNSRLEVTLDEAGVYHVSAGALYSDESGAYTLTVERR